MPTRPIRLTRHHVPRATRPDAETTTRLYLFKSVSVLRATYQIRLLLSQAEETGKKLIVRVPKACGLGKDLDELRREHAARLMVERV